MTSSPVVTLGAVSAPAVRTGAQAVSGELIVQGLELFNLAHLTPAQHVWLVVVLTPLLSALQNFIEKRRGRRLIGVGRRRRRP